MGFLPDGGMALKAGKVRLPANIFLSELTVLSQPLMKWEAGKTVVSVDLFGYLFSFVIPLTDDEIRARLAKDAFIRVHKFYAGPLEQSATTGERFRAVFCSVSS